MYAFFTGISHAHSSVTWKKKDFRHGLDEIAIWNLLRTVIRNYLTMPSFQVYNPSYARLFLFSFSPSNRSINRIKTYKRRFCTIRKEEEE